MSRSTARSAIYRVVFLPTLIGLLCGTASADQAASPKLVQIGDTPSLVVNGIVDTLEIPVSREVLPMLYFTAPVKRAKAIGGDDKLVGTGLVREQNVVMIYPRRQLQPGEVPTVRVEANGFDAYFKLREAAPGETVELAYRVWHHTEQEALQALIDSRVQNRTDEQEAERQATYDKKVQSAATKAFVQMMREHRNRVPAREKIKTDGGDVVLGLDVATWLKDDVFLLVPIHNTSHRPFKPKAPHVFDERGIRYEAKLVDPGPYGTEASDHEALIPGHTETSVVVHIPGVGGAQFDKLRVVFEQADGLPKAWAEVEEWPNPFMRPKSAKEVERDRRARQVALAFRGVTGGYWFSDGTGLGREKAAVMAGISAHLQKGFGNGLALEAEIQLARTWDARFDDVVVGESSGELTRNALVGRVIVGGSAGFGYPTRAALRIGLGIQGASNDAIFSSGSGSMEGPRAELETATFLIFGASVRRRWGEHAVIGVEGSVVRPDGDDTLFRRSIELGVYLGFGWSLGQL